MTKQLITIPATAKNMETFRQLLISLGVHPMYAYPSINGSGVSFGTYSTGLCAMDIYTDGETSLYTLGYCPAGDWRYTNVFKEHESMFEVAQFIANKILKVQDTEISRLLA